MKTTFQFRSLRLVVPLLALAFVFAAGLSNAQDVVRYRPRPIGNKVHIDGVANIHNWVMDGSLIGGYFEIPAALVLDSAQGDIAGAGKGEVPAKAEVSIPVSSIKNAEWDGMSEVMLQAMNAATNPYIKFVLTNFSLKLPHAAGTPILADARGELIINALTNSIAFPVQIETVETNRLKISAKNIPVSMTDYKIKPPVKMGVFVTEPGVKISFDWILAVPKKASAAK